jgi:hypothetical protein
MMQSRVVEGCFYTLYEIPKIKNNSEVKKMGSF